METMAAVPVVLPGARERLATRITFFVAGFSFAAWAPMVPYVKEAAGLSEGALGLLLLCLGAGSLLAMPIAGAASARFGCRGVILGGWVLVGLALPVLATSTAVPVLAAALMIFGGGLGGVDCVINVQAVIVERASGRSMMSGFHGLFSVGGLVGAAVATFLLASGVSPTVTAVGVVALMALLMGVASGGLLRGGAGEGGGHSAFAVPRGAVLFLGVLCFIVFLAEGSILDWSAVFLAEVRGMDPRRAGLGYVAFATTMTAGRLTGDALVNRLGKTRAVGLGGAIAAIGLGLVTFVPSWQAALVGFALVGAGCSNVVPVLFTAAGRQASMPEHLAIPAVTTLGYAGVLAGPAGIGFLAQSFGLPAAFGVVMLLLIGVALSGRFLPVED